MSDPSQETPHASHPPIPGPPYPPTTASMGGVPSLSVDVPIASVFLVLYIISAVCHMTILQINNRRGHKFLISGALFGYSMARTTTMIMRIVWACYPTNIQIAMAASILVVAGVVILYIVNLIFAQRVIRAAHPKLGWSKPFSIFFMALYALVIISLIMVIIVVVQSYYTLNPNTKQIDHDIQLAGSSYFMFVAFLPLPMVLIAVLSPRRDGRRLDKFGKGRWRTKVTMLLVATCFLIISVVFRNSTNYKDPRPIDNPAWYDSKSCFWIFDFVCEISVIYLYLLMRVDRRFHIPNGSKAHGDYSRKDVEVDLSKQPSGASHWSNNILSDEEIFKEEEGTEKPQDEEEGNLS